MAEHEAMVVWRSKGEFAAGRYSRAHAWHFDGGAVVRASSSPSIVPVPLSDPAGVDPEEALVASASACHMLWFLSLARNEGFVVERYEDRAVGIMGKDERGRIALLTIRLRPTILFEGRRPDAAGLAALHDGAHDKCFIANSLRCRIEVEGA